MYSKEEEFWNIATHAIGVTLSIPAFILLLKFNSDKVVYATSSIIVYCFSIFFLYSASTLYHLTKSAKRKHFFRKLDHIGIYVLIAGTYTPVLLISLVNGKGWLLFYIVWIIAAFGTVLKIFFTGKFEKVSLFLYLVMGWLIVLDFNNLILAHSTLGLSLLGLGGFFYTVGTYFYVKEKIPYNHAIWHCFVLGGSISHFLFILIDIV